jgi:hypothetical protein
MKTELTLLNTKFETIQDGLPNVLFFKILKGGKNGHRGKYVAGLSGPALDPVADLTQSGPTLMSDSRFSNFSQYDGAARRA